MKKNSSRFFVAILALLSFSYSAYGASGTWSGAADATWANSGNWSAAPPSTGDTATFNATIVNGNGTTNPVVIDSGRQVKSITFDTAAASAYVIGTTGGNALTLGTGGAITINTTVVTAQTINAPLIIGGTAASTYSFSNNSASAASTLSFGGAINGAATAGNTVLTLNGANATTAVNTISGVIGDGAGGGTLGTSITNSTWALTNANTYSGGTTLNNSTALLILGNNSALGLGALTATSGTLSASTTLSNVANNIVAGTFTIGGTNAMTLTGSLTNSGANRTITISNTGTTTFSGNTIYLSEAVGTGRTLTLNGSGNIVINDAIADFNGAGTAGNFTYTGTGSLTLAGNNTYTGTTTFGNTTNPASNGRVTITGNNTLVTGAVTLNNGYLLLGSSAALGGGTVTIGSGYIDNVSGSAMTEVNNPAWTLSNGFTFLGSNNLNLGAGAVSFTGSRTITLGDSNNVNLTFGGAATNTSTTAAITTTVNARTGVTGETLVFNNGFALEGAGGTGGIVDIFNGSGNITINGGVTNGSASGANGLTYSGTGILTLANAGSYTGNTTLSNGTLVLGNNAAMGTTGTFTQSGGILQGSTALTLGNNIIDSGTMTVGGSNSVTFNGTYTATNGANRTLNNSDSSNVTLAGNVFLSDSATVGRTFTINGTGNTVISGVIANFNGAGVASGLTFNPSVSTATLTLSNNNTYTGTTAVNNGTLFATLGSTGTPLGSGALTLNGGTLDFAPTGTGSAISYTDNGGAFTFNTGTIVVNKGGQTSLAVTLGSGAPGRVSSTKGLLLVQTGSTGTLGTTEDLSFGAAPTVSNGMINANIVGLGTTTAGLGDFLTYGAGGFTGLSVATYTNHATDFTTTAAEISNVTGNANVTTTGAVRGFLVQNGVTATLNGTLGFNASGAGLILNGGTISGGTINLVNNTEEDFYAFGAPSTINSKVTISSGANATSLVVGGTQTITLNGSLALANGAGSVTVAGGGLTIAGTTSAATNFTVAGGTLNLNSSYANTTGTVTVGSELTSALTEGAVNAISGSSALAVSNGTATLSKANNYTGTTTVSSVGTLNLTATGAINGSAVSMAQDGSGTLNLNAVNALTGTSSLGMSGNPNAGTGGTINVNQSQNFTGGVTIGGGTLNISGSGTFTGSNVTETSGTVNLNTAGAISQGTYTYRGGGLIENIDDAISGTAGLTVNGTNSLTLYRANNYTGATTLISGSNPFSTTGTSSGSGAGTMSGVTLDFGQAVSPVNNIINNGLTHATIGTGSTLVLGGASLNIIGKNNAVNGQEFNNLNLTEGQNFLTVIKGTGTTAAMNVALNAINRSTGATISFGSGSNTNIGTSTGTITTTNANANFSGGQATILGGWATYGTGTWASVGAGGVISGLTNYTTLTPGSESLAQGKDVDAGGYNNFVSSPLSSVNSIRFNAGPSEVTLGQDLVIATGGILATTSTNNFIDGGVNLTSGNGQDLILIQNSTGTLEIDDNITNNGTTAIGLTTGGQGLGLILLGGTNTFTGPLTINNDGTVRLNNANALNGSTGVAVAFNFQGVSGGSLDLNGFNATVTNVSDNVGTVALNGGPNFNNSNTANAATLTINNAANNVFDGGIQNSTGAILNLVKSGTGTLTLTANARSGNGGLNLAYSGTTTVNGGKLYFAETNSINPTGTSSLQVNAGGSIGSIGGFNNTIGNGTTFLATVAGGSSASTRGTIDMTDGVAGGGLAFAATSGNTSLVIGDANGAGGISLDVGNGTADLIRLGTGTTTQNKINVGTGGIAVNLVGLGGLNGTTQTIVATSGFDALSSISTFTGNAGAGLAVQLATTSGNFNGYTVALLGSGNNLQITETANTLTGTTLYYSGNNSAGGTVTGGTSAWNSFTGGNSNNSNFAYTSTTGVDSNQMANSTINLHFGAAPTNAAALANYTNNTLGADFTLTSLTYDSGVTGNITTSGNNNLTLSSATGITDSATSGTQTISTNLLSIGASQTWSVASGASLVVGSAIKDNANNFSLTKTGGGALTLSGNDVYSGGTIVSAGALYANGASSTGGGSVSVTGTGTLSGLGTIQPVGGTSASIGVTVASGAILAPGMNSISNGAAAPGQAAIPYTGTPGTLANGSLTLDTSKFAGTTGASFSAGAGLTFALGASHTSSTLIAGATTVAFNVGGTGSTSTVVSINDLVGAGLTLNGEYTLIDGNASTVYSGLTYGATTSQGTIITGGLTLLVPSSSGTNFFADYYNTSQLFLTSGNDIDVYVIPEPGTWALMIGGFALLLFVQRRKRKLD